MKSASTKAFLVFPSCLEASVRFAADARRFGFRIIGASSLAEDPYADRYDGWARLPYINEPPFFAALKSVVDHFGIEGIHTPHALIYLFFATEIKGHLPGIRLVGEAPHARQMRLAEEALAGAAAKLGRAQELGGVPLSLDPRFLAALLAQADSIFGECSEEKILALCGIFGSAPRGDVVEIGSLFGKSAYVLNRLACRAGIGLTLAVDPWDGDAAAQHELPEALRIASKVWNWDRVFDGFLLTMQGCTIPPFNYVRATSEQARMSYRACEAVHTPQFGETALAGKIAVLHIDGNHDEAEVTKDLSLWSECLAAGGWIILDDYEWSHGDGPRKAGDRAIAAYGPRVRRRFVAGGALFVQID
jgi:hypothetical protein